MRIFLSLLATAALSFTACGSEPATTETTKPAPTPTAESVTADSTAPATTAAVEPAPAVEPQPDPQPNPDFPFSTTRPKVAIETNMGRIEAELFADQAPETVTTFIKLAEGAMLSKRGNEEANHKFYDGLTFHRVIPNFMIQGGCPLGSGSGDPGFSYGDEINADSLGLNQELVIQNGDNLLKLLAPTGQVTPAEQQMLAQTAVHEQVSYMLRQIIQQVIAPKAQEANIQNAKTPEETSAIVKKVLDDLKDYSLKDYYQQQGYKYRDDLPPSSKPVRGSLALANSGPATNGSQFFINVADTPHLTGKHTVFGHVTSGMEIADKISTAVASPSTNRPTQPIVIESIRLIEPASVDELFKAP